MGRSEDLYLRLGQLIRASRSAAGLTQEKLASRVGLTRTSINNIEHGRQKVLVHTLYDIADALGVLPSALLPKDLLSEEKWDQAGLLSELAPAEQQWVRAVLAQDPE